MTTDDIYAGIDYQPLNLGAAYGRLVSVKAADLPKTYLSFQDIVVLDHAPNDITTVLGIVSEEFLTPRSRLNCAIRLRCSRVVELHCVVQ